VRASQISKLGTASRLKQAFTAKIVDSANKDGITCVRRVGDIDQRLNMSTQLTPLVSAIRIFRQGVSACRWHSSVFHQSSCSFPPPSTRLVHLRASISRRATFCRSACGAKSPHHSRSSRVSIGSRCCWPTRFAVAASPVRCLAETPQS
jgi:predicted DNA-binding ribbon-helix-helix protein